MKFFELQWTLLTSDLRINSGHLQGKVSVAYFNFLLPIRWGYCPSHLLGLMLTARFNHPRLLLDNVSLSTPLRWLEKVIKWGHFVSLWRNLIVPSVGHLGKTGKCNWGQTLCTFLEYTSETFTFVIYWMQLIHFWWKVCGKGFSFFLSFYYSARMHSIGKKLQYDICNVIKGF